MLDLFTRMRAALQTLLALFVLLLPIQAGAQQLCTPASSALVIGYFNGVFTGPQAANDQLQQLFSRLEPIARQQSIPAEPQLLYNHTALILDLIEVFQQRLAEDAELNAALGGRMELFWDLVRNGPLTQQLVARIPRYSTVVVIPTRAAIPLRIASALARTSSTLTAFTTTRHKSTIDQHLISGKRFLFVAHSQGNFFANRAFAYTRPLAGQNSIGMIHNASPSAVVNGPWVRNSEDVVINAVAATVTVPAVTHTITPPSQRPGSDPTAHGFVETYLNPALPMEQAIVQHADTIIRGLAPRQAQASEGFFTVTLTWDGAGDVDLHVFEPNGVQVFYNNQEGTSGVLDFDNTVANGPENYFASCNPSVLQTGIYRVALNNFARASGRTATVLIKTARQGVLGTFTQVQGPDRGTSGNASPIDVARIRVQRDSTTGLWSANLVN